MLFSFLYALANVTMSFFCDPFQIEQYPTIARLHLLGNESRASV
jgi:hypothetical protein